MQIIDPKMDETNNLITRVESLIDRLESFLPPKKTPIDWSALAWRWQVSNNQGNLHAVNFPHNVHLDDIKNVDEQKSEIIRNTLQFINGLPANNVLLTGARGTGKSSLIKALLTEFSSNGLRLVEVERNHLVYLPDIVSLLRERAERFIIFCDDLTFESADTGYKALKVTLDGSIACTSENVIIYATSNRRHLLPEYMAENLDTHYLNDEIRPNDTVEEKVSLSERFGLWLSFYPFSQDEYLSIVSLWIKRFGIMESNGEVRNLALQFSLSRGSRSGRIAYQFARDYAGKILMEKIK